jgi:hypothetical protein
MRARAATTAALVLFSGAKYITVGLLIPSVYPCTLSFIALGANDNGPYPYPEEPHDARMSRTVREWGRGKRSPRQP